MKRPRNSGLPQLSRRDEQIIVALLEHPTQEKAAAAVGISKTTLWRRQKKLEFQKALNEARREAYAHAVARLQQGSGAAAATLLRVMTDTTAPAASRVRAAQCVLDNASRGIELQDLAVRLRAVEIQRTREEILSDDLEKAA